METQYQFRFFKSTWGISINLIANDIPYLPFHAEVKVTEQIFLQIDLSFKIHETEKDFIAQAIVRLSQQIHEKLLGQKITIKITSIEFDETDYQAEGLYVTMLGWISKRYDIPVPSVNVEYNKESKKYTFEI